MHITPVAHDNMEENQLMRGHEAGLCRAHLLVYHH